MALSIMVSNNAPCWVCISVWIAFSRNAAPVAETLNFSASAMRASSAFTTGLTHKTSCTVFRVGMGRFCVRGGFVCNGCERKGFGGDAGCGVAVRARGAAGLSCRTPRSGCWTLAE